MWTRNLTLRSFLTFALLAVLLPVVLASGGLFYRSAALASEDSALDLTREVAQRVGDKVESFFDVPQRVVAFNVELARAGQLPVHEPEQLMWQFMMQIEQQPQLTFISMGTADGQYYAGSRPPQGIDRAPRMLRAQISEGRAMEVLRVDERSRTAVRISRSDVNYDARARPWYRTAIEQGGVSWYAPYRYKIEDEQGAYLTNGMGVAAPLRNVQGELVGVITADLAMSQLNEFLGTVSRETGGRAFLADASGALLAQSFFDTRTAQAGDDAERRPHVAESTDPVVRAMGQLIAASGERQGNLTMEVQGERHWMRWWRHNLDNGPELTMAMLWPEAHFNAPLRGVLRNTIYTTMAVLLVSVLFSLFVASWLVRPLQSLSRWAKQLTQSDWNAKAPRSSPIAELRALGDAMGYMARHLQDHAQDLEAMVAQRTRELESAVAEVEKTVIEQRHFIAMLSHEVRSPLAVINTAGQVLAFRSRNDAAQLALAQRILRGSARLSHFFDNCLTQDRLDSDNFALQPSPVDAAELATWVAENGAQLSTDHRVLLQLEPDLPAVQGDAVLLRVMLMNLISNAFKYAPHGSTVRLSVQRAGTVCRFLVEDEGPGISAEEQQHVFEKYRRGRTAEGKPGAGLGLALVKGIADLHGAHIVLQTRQPTGLLIAVELPFSQA